MQREYTQSKLRESVIWSVMLIQIDQDLAGESRRM
jgi:hypothetical protein